MADKRREATPMAAKRPPAPPRSFRASAPEYLGMSEHQRRALLSVPDYVRKLLGKYVNVTIYTGQNDPVLEGNAGQFINYFEEGGRKSQIDVTPWERLPIPVKDSLTGTTMPPKTEYLPGGVPMLRTERSVGVLSNTAPHEVAHFADALMGLHNDVYKFANRSSEQPLLQSLYRRYCSREYPFQMWSSVGVTPYGCTNPQEFLAEVMATYWDSRSRAKMQVDAPELYAYARAFDNRLKYWPNPAGPIPPAPPLPVEALGRRPMRKLAQGPPDVFKRYTSRNESPTMDYADVLRLLEKAGIPPLPQRTLDRLAEDRDLRYELGGVLGSDFPMFPNPTAPLDPFPYTYWMVGAARQALMRGDIDQAIEIASQWYVEQSDQKSQVRSERAQVLKEMAALGIPISVQRASRWAERYADFEELVAEDDLLLPIKAGATDQDFTYVHAIRHALERGDLTEASNLYFDKNWTGHDRYMNLNR